MTPKMYVVTHQRHLPPDVPYIGDWHVSEPLPSGDFGTRNAELIDAVSDSFASTDDLLQRLMICSPTARPLTEEEASDIWGLLSADRHRLSEILRCQGLW